MKDWASVQTYKSGTFPNVLAIDSTGAATPDGTEYIAAQINNGIFGWSQDFMDYAGLTPDGVIEAAAACQLREAIQKGNGIGPGMYVQRAIYDNPAAHGDRVIILSEQGILHASYPELTEAVYVGDANNAAVAAAGGKFYKSTDAGGATPSTSGTYLQLPAQPHPTYLKQYSEANGDFTATGSNWTTVLVVAVPYQTIDETWRLIFNVIGTVSSATRTTYTVTLSGITFSTAQLQAIAACPFQSYSLSRAFTVTSAGQLTIEHASGTTTGYSFSGDVELDSKPTWADDFDIEWGITY